MSLASAYSMCLFYALDQWVIRGGYLLLRRSHHLPGGLPHVLHLDAQGVVRHYVPIVKPRVAVATFLGFYGNVEVGDTAGAPTIMPTPWTILLSGVVFFGLATPWALWRLVRPVHGM